jgi:hypothetical protein
LPRGWHRRARCPPYLERRRSCLRPCTPRGLRESPPRQPGYRKRARSCSSCPEEPRARRTSHEKPSSMQKRSLAVTLGRRTFRIRGLHRPRRPPARRRPPGDARARHAGARGGAWKLVSRIFVENEASRMLVAAVGFREVGTYYRHARLDGVWRDVVIVDLFRASS